MTNHWDNELEIIALARKAMKIEMSGNFNPETITTVGEAIGLIEQVLDRYEEKIVREYVDEDVLNPQERCDDCGAFLEIGFEEAHSCEEDRRLRQVRALREVVDIASGTIRS